MYMIESMINMGLEEGQEWPSDAHKRVALNIGLYNLLVKDIDTLTNICQSVISVPQDRIELVTFEDLVTEFNCPNVT